MTDNLAALVQHETLNGFESMLQPSGRFHRQPRAHQQEKSQQKRENKQLHRERVRDRRYRILGLDVKRPQKRGDRSGEQMVQNFGKPELFA